MWAMEKSLDFGGNLDHFYVGFRVRVSVRWGTSYTPYHWVCCTRRIFTSNNFARI